MPGDADLQAAALTLADVPSGMAAQPPAQGPLGSVADCPVLSADPPGQVASAVVTYANPAGPAVSETLYQTKPGDAAPIITSFATLPTTCPQVTVTVDGLTIPLVTTALTIDTIGDATAADRLIYSVGGTPVLYADVVAIRHQDTVILLFSVDFTANTTQTTALARTAYTRVAARW